MTSIRDIPYDDIKKFISANYPKYDIKKEDDVYKKALKLLKNENAIGHTISIIEWMMARNLLINKVDIQNYTIDDIDNMSQSEINNLARLLGMKGNNRDNIKNILRYINKLSEQKLLPELNEMILNFLTELEMQDIDVSKLKYDDIIRLLKTHRNKKAIRQFIDDNLEKIILYNTLNINFDEYPPEYIVSYYDKYGDNSISLYLFLDRFLNNVNVYNKNIMLEIMLDNKRKFDYYDDNEINQVIDSIKNKTFEPEKDNIFYIEMYQLIGFTLDLINNKEIRLAKKVFDIANKLRYAHYYGRSYSYNIELIKSMNQNSELLETIINFMGEDEFLNNYFMLPDHEDFADSINLFTNLVELEKYDLLVNIIQTYIDMNYDDKAGLFAGILRGIQRAINSKDKRNIIEYIKEFYRSL
jgi:hypothetical protein